VALDWYRRAAEQGLADAQNSLGVLLAMSSRNFPEAMRWCGLAAEQVPLDKKTPGDSRASHFFTFCAPSRGPPLVSCYFMYFVLPCIDWGP